MPSRAPTLFTLTLLGCGTAVTPSAAPSPPPVPASPQAAAANAPAVDASAPDTAQAHAPIPVAAIEPELGSLQLSADEVWSAVRVVLRPSGDQAVALVEEAGGARRLVRLLGRGKDRPFFQFVTPRRLVVGTLGGATVHDLATGHELAVPSRPLQYATLAARWVTVSPDGEIIVVSSEALAIEARFRVPGADVQTMDPHLLDPGRIVLRGQDRVGPIVVIDAKSGRVLSRFEDAFDYAVEGNVLAVVHTPDGAHQWTIQLHDVGTGRPIGPLLDVGPLGNGPVVTFQGKDMLVASTPDGDLRFDLLDAATGAVRLTRRLRPGWSADRVFPWLAADGRVCVVRWFDWRTYDSDAMPALDLRRGAEIRPSPSVDRLCLRDGVVELPAALHGARRTVVPSVSAGGVLGSVHNNAVYAPGHLLARVEVAADNKPDEGPREPRLALIDLTKKREVREIPLPEERRGGGRWLSLEFSPDGTRLAVEWDRRFLLLEVPTLAAVVPLVELESQSFGNVTSFTPTGRYLLREDALPLDARTGQPIPGPWWTSSALP